MSLTGTAENNRVLRGKLSGLKTVHGYSAYEVAVINGFSGTEEEWLASLKGEKGEQGPQGTVVFEELTEEEKEMLKGNPGEDGKDGQDGEDGKDGVSVTHRWDGTKLVVTSASGTSSADLKGAKGDKGDTGPQGLTGATGPQGNKGDTGATGPQGPKGDTGSGFKVLDYYASLSALQSAVPKPNVGDAYGVGTADPYDIYIYGETSGWVNNGPLQGAKGDKGDKGDTGPAGDDGERGTCILKITTQPENYTTAIGDYTPKYRIAIATAISESGVSEVLIGDTVWFSYYHYTIDYLDDTYAYISVKRVSVRGATGVTFTPAVDSAGNLSWTNDGGLDNPANVNIMGPQGPAGADGAKGDKGDQGEKGPQGEQGEKGDTGATGATGANATINGVNALTIETDEYIEATQSGSVLTLGLKSAPSSSEGIKVTLSSSGWTDNGDGRYKQTVNVAGVTTDASQIIVVDVYQDGTDLDADATVLEAWLDASGPAGQNKTQGNGTMTFYCAAVPSVNIPVVVGVH